MVLKCITFDCKDLRQKERKLAWPLRFLQRFLTFVCSFTIFVVTALLISLVECLHVKENELFLSLFFSQNYLWLHHYLQREIYICHNLTLALVISF